MNWTRALLVWLAIIAAETVHGILRQLLLVPLVGDVAARQIGVPVGCLIILAITCACIRWLGSRTISEHLQVGVVWVVLTVVFELGLGLALGYSRERILSDYNIFQGGYMGLGLLFMLCAPALAFRLRRLH